jgi:translation initiation factor IF-2
MNINEIIKKVLKEEFNNNSLIYEDMYGSVEEVNFLTEAEYQGRKVNLGKIMQGDIKKFKVYVKNDKGKVVKVNFGFGGKSAKGKRMVIKKNNPERRKSFRARHNCDNPGPRWKPRYWACRTW